MSKPKVDLTLLKRLVVELEGALNIMDAHMDVNTDLNEFVVEGSKAVGLAAGVMQESAEIMVRIHAVLDSAVDQVDLLDKIISPGSSN